VGWSVTNSTWNARGSAECGRTRNFRKLTLLAEMEEGDSILFHSLQTKADEERERLGAGSIRSFALSRRAERFTAGSGREILSAVLQTGLAPASLDEDE